MRQKSEEISTIENQMVADEAYLNNYVKQGISRPNFDDRKLPYLLQGLMSDLNFLKKRYATADLTNEDQKLFLQFISKIENQSVNVCKKLDNSEVIPSSFLSSFNLTNEDIAFLQELENKYKPSIFWHKAREWLFVGLGLLIIISSILIFALSIVPFTAPFIITAFFFAIPSSFLMMATSETLAKQRPISSDEMREVHESISIKVQRISHEIGLVNQKVPELASETVEVKDVDLDNSSIISDKIPNSNQFKKSDAFFPLKNDQILDSQEEPKSALEETQDIKRGL